MKWLISTWTAVVLIAVASVWLVYPDWLTANESGSATLRNLGLVVAGLVGLPLAIWRSVVAEHQADAAQRQSNIAFRSLLNERFQKGAEMLGHPDNMSVRLGGIHALDRLAKDHPETFYLQVIQLLGAFVVSESRSVQPQIVPAFSTNAADCSKQGDQQIGAEPRADLNEYLSHTCVAHNNVPAYLMAKATIPAVQRIGKDVEEAMRIIAQRDEKQTTLENRVGFRLNLADAVLGGLTLREPNFSNIDFTKADLRRARLWGACFSNSRLAGANLAAASFVHSDFRDADLRRVDLTAADLSGSDLRNVDLSLVDLASENLWGAHIFPSQLTCTMLCGVDLRNAELGNAVMQGASLGGANLEGASLAGAKLTRADLRAAKLKRADLSEADLRYVNLGGAGADLSDADLSHSNLTGANVASANLAGTKLNDSDVTETDFVRNHQFGNDAPVQGLTQDQLNQAKADPHRPPILSGVLDAKTGAPLVWRGAALD